MQIRCTNCHRPFALAKDAVHNALDHLVSQGQTSYSIACPHCRRVNHISLQELRRAAPDWKEPQGQAETSAAHG